MRRGCVLAAMLAIVALLLLCARLLRADSPESAAPQTSAAPDAPAYEMMYARALSDLASIDVTLADGSSYRVLPCMAFDDAGNLLGVYSALGQPLLVEGREDFALDSVAYQMMLLAAQGIPSTARYPALDQSACGLAEPRARILVRYTDGSETTLRLGNKTASGASCYVAMDGGELTYLVPYDFYDVMTRPLNAHHRLPGAIDYDASDAVQIAMDNTAQGRIIVTRQDGGARVLDWQVTSPIAHDASSDAVEDFIAGLCAVHAEQYVATAYDAAGLEPYGLAEPVRCVAAFSDGVIRDIHVGGDAGEGRVYVRMDGTGDIYAVSRSQLDFASGDALDLLMDRFVDLVPLSTVESVTVQRGESRWQLTQTWAQDDETAQSWAVNGQSVAQSDFSALYTLLIGMQFDKTAPGAPDVAQPDVNVTYVLRDGSTRALSFRPYDAFYVSATTAGGANLLVRRTKLEALIEALEVYPDETH